MQNTRTKLAALAFAFFTAGLGTALPAYAVDAPLPPHPGSVERAKVGRAVELLDAATAYLKHNGASEAFTAFNDPKGSFVYGPYYVYVVGKDGFMHANGGTQFALAGKNAMDLRDAAGKPLVRDLLAASAQNPKGSVEYRWLNPEDHQIEVKTSLYNVVDGYIVSVGYYTPRATQAEAQALLSRAVSFLKETSPEIAFASFNNPQGGFTQDDQYVFAVGLEDGKYRASGAAPQLNGMDVRGIRDAAGHALFEEMIAMAKNKGSGMVDYVWRNPATNAVESKHTLVQRVGDVLLGVGYYTR
jgi:cytochrome c